jgi:alpha-ribazole phosphatase
MFEFIRHGLPEGGEVYRGSAVDDPLSETGWRQMWDSIGNDSGWQRVVSSPMRRCRAFAEQLSERLELRLTVETELHELGYGIWEGKTPEQAIALDPEWYDACYRDPLRFRPPGAESLQQAAQRVSAVFTRLLEESADQEVLIVAHAGIIRLAIAQGLALPMATAYATHIEYATRVRITLD